MSAPRGRGQAEDPEDPRPPRRSHNIRRAARAFRILLPGAVILLILTNVDMGRLLRLSLESNLPLLILGLVFMPTRVVTAGLRWWLLLRTAFGSPARFGFALRHYWSGVAIGFFTPGSAGLEVYRVGAAARRLGALSVQIAIVVIEKLAALVACAGLALASVPFLPGLAIGPAAEVRALAGTVLLLLVLASLGLAVGNIALRTRLTDRVARQFLRLQNRVSTAAPGYDRKQVPSEPKLREGMRPLMRPNILAMTLSTSLLVQLAGAIGIQIMFRAVGYDIPFVVNLFVVPILYIIFAVPISLGSIGVREGAFIVLYGLFGVPAEVALLVSLLNLAGLLVNSLIGAVTMWGGGPARSSKRLRDAPGGSG